MTESACDCLPLGAGSSSRRAAACAAACAGIKGALGLPQSGAWSAASVTSYTLTPPSPPGRELYREKQVVAEERASRIDNSPLGSLFYDFALRVRRRQGAGGRGRLQHSSTLQHAATSNAGCLQCSPAPSWRRSRSSSGATAAPVTDARPPPLPICRHQSLSNAYRRPVLGFKEDLDDLGRLEVADFFSRWGTWGRTWGGGPWGQARGGAPLSSSSCSQEMRSSSAPPAGSC